MSDQENTEVEVALTDKQLKCLDVFEKQGANVTHACKAADISRTTFYQWVNESNTYKKRFEDIRESMIDFAESELKKQIKSGNTTATIFFLKTIGKGRGYVERQELDISGGLKLKSITSSDSDEEAARKYQENLKASRGG